MNKNVIDYIVEYKISVALFAANKLKLFDYLNEHKCFDMSICEKNKWDRTSFHWFCKFLEDIGCIVKDGEQWRLSNDFEKLPVKHIINKEDMLYHKWITPTMLTETIQYGENNREFNKSHFNQEEQEIYDNVVYGNNLYVIVFYLLRKIKKNIFDGSNILEYGRSEGRVSYAMKKYVKNLNLYKVPLNGEIEHNAKFDLVIIYNSIHYMESDNWTRVIEKIKKVLQPNGVVCVVDFFYNHNCNFSSTILLDWIACGGLYNATDKDVVRLFETSGFCCFDNIYMQELYSQAIVFNHKV